MSDNISATSSAFFNENLQYADSVEEKIKSAVAIATKESNESITEIKNRMSEILNRLE